MSEQNVDHIVIRRIEAGDFAGLQRIQEQPLSVWSTLPSPYPATQLWRQRLARRTAQYHALVASSQREVVGTLGLAVRGEAAHRAHAATIGMTVHDKWQSRGIGGALLQAAVNLADRWLNVRRLELTVEADNASALRLYTKWGFEIEGLLRNYACRDGRFVDAYTLARVR